jgi:3-phenylpropionate/trans-cinnamate dioxygenase ferredoxin reductase component
MANRVDVLIVGAGQGGAQAAIVLRQQKFAGSILVVGDEPDLPYERPALSKEYLAGERAFEKMLLRPASFWAERNVTMRLGARVESVDAAKHEVRVGGEAIGYGVLVWAAGGRPRRIGLDLGGVHYVRERADVDRLISELADVTDVVVVGGGYIGLEAAAVLSKLGKRIVVLEGENRVLARVAGEPLSRFFEAEHRAQGVEIRLASCAAALEQKDGRVTGVRLASGDVLPAQIVIVGIGIVPAVEPLLSAGARAAPPPVGGVEVDLTGKTSAPNIYAVGDCAAHPSVHASGRPVRLESVQNAIDQATIAAKSIAGTLGPDERYEAIPWFWSNQYDLRLQTVGLHLDHDAIVVRGEPSTRAFAVAYLRAEKLVALDCVNRTKDYMQGKALIASGRPVDRARLADIDVLLKDLV